MPITTKTDRGKQVRGKTTTYAVSVPTTSARYVSKVAKLVGVSESSFLAVALMRGVKAIHRDNSPETFFTPEMLASLSEMAKGVIESQAAESNEKK